MDALFALLVLLLVGWFWLDALRAWERAVGLVRRACDAHGLQMLDQAVALRRIGLRWTPAGLRLRRVYRFEFSDGGLDRQAGELILLGSERELLRLPLPPDWNSAPPRWPDASGLVCLDAPDQPPPERPASGASGASGDGAE